jgi:hypothetical protein
VPLSPAMPMMFDIFKMNEDAKVIQIDAKDPTKIVQVRATFNPK